MDLYPLNVATPPLALQRSPAANANRQSGAQRLWSQFWREFGLVDQPHERCHVPGDGQRVVDRHWNTFADTLPHNAKVIDLGCGAGVVGRALLRRRGDLNVTGIDWANVPASGISNLAIHPRVSMEALPFADQMFDAAVSLFGVEYGQIDRTGNELARVLRPGATISFLTHHRDSEIVREGAARRDGLQALLQSRMKQAFLTGDLPGIGKACRGLSVQFPHEPLVGDIARHLSDRVSHTRAERQRVWQFVVDGLAPEIALLAQLNRAAKSADELSRWLAPLLGFMIELRVRTEYRGSGGPIAWNVSGAR